MNRALRYAETASEIDPQRALGVAMDVSNHVLHGRKLAVDGKTNEGPLGCPFPTFPAS